MVLEGNDSIPQDPYVMLDGITLEELRRILSEAADKALVELTENMTRANQRSASLEQDARQPTLAMEADVTTDTKTRKRTDGAVAAKRVMSGDINLIRLTSFGDDSTGPPTLLCSRDDALVDEDAAPPKPCLSPG